MLLSAKCDTESLKKIYAYILFTVVPEEYCSCEENAKAGRFGHEGIFLLKVTLHLAAKNSGVGKLNLLCQMLLILCLYVSNHTTVDLTYMSFLFS